MEASSEKVGLARKIQYDFLESGSLTIGSKLPTVSEMARRYKVSDPTIRKAVTELAGQGWLSKRRGSGIYVEALPEALHTKIGYISTYFRSPLESHVLEGINSVAHSQNCDLAVASSRGDLTKERSQLQIMRKRGVRGVVICCAAAVGRDSYEDYLATEFRDYPIVVLDVYSPKMCRPHVLVDNCQAGYEMTQYLLSQNRRRIAFIKFDKVFNRSVEERFSGYKKALEEAGIPLVAEHIVSYDFSESTSNQDIQAITTQRLMSTTPRPDAIITLTDSFVPPSISYLRSCNIAVPQDVVMCGFDNLPRNHTAEVWPTTNPDFVQMGEVAMEMLLDQIKTGDFSPSGVVLPCPLLLPEEQKNVKSRYYSNYQAKATLLNV